MPRARQPSFDARSVLGLSGVIVWMLMFGVADHAHDRLMAERDAAPDEIAGWATAYEIAAGYVLGFVAAVTLWLIARLIRGPVPDLLAESIVGRVLTGAGLFAVQVSALAGLAMHNLGGLSLTYDVSFLVGAGVVAGGVLPLYRRWRGR